MSIHKIGSDAARVDRVDISGEGREPAPQMLREGERDASSRISLIRARMEQGFYNDPVVAEMVAERLFASGDLYGPVAR